MGMGTREGEGEGGVVLPDIMAVTTIMVGSKNLLHLLNKFKKMQH